MSTQAAAGADKIIRLLPYLAAFQADLKQTFPQADFPGLDVSDYGGRGRLFAL